MWTRKVEQPIISSEGAREQKQELRTADDVTALAAEQIEKVMPLDKEISEPFQYLMKKLIEQARE